MSLVTETLVEEWLNRKGYFTIRGAKKGGAEMDLLAVSFHEPDALHVEVSVSVHAIGYISGPPISGLLNCSHAPYAPKVLEGQFGEVNVLEHQTRSGHTPPNATLLQSGLKRPRSRRAGSRAPPGGYGT